MNESSDKHTPTDEFVEYLARDTMRRLRHEARFAAPPVEHRSRSRIPSALGIAAGVVMTLSTGMVLGASANYASAAVLPNGTTTIPSRPALAILPIRNALTAIGCTQPAEQPVGVTSASTSTTSPVAAGTPAPGFEPSRSEPAVADQVATQTLPAKPDRAMIAMLARQHQSAVVRGDSAFEYLVIVLDASQNHVWSTHGNGNVSIEVGGDPRSRAERVEYNRIHESELMGKFKLSTLDSTRARDFVFSRDSQAMHFYQYYRGQGALDSGRTMAIQLNDAALARRARADSATSNGAAVGRAGGRGGAADGIGRGMVVVPTDSLARRYSSWRITDSTRDVYYYASPTTLGCAVGAGSARRSRVTGTDSASGAYTTGFTEPRYGIRCNLAAGLQERGAGLSGVVGLASANVSRTESYVFAAGELAPRDLKVLAVYLTPGTAWAGR